MCCLSVFAAAVFFVCVFLFVLPVPAFAAAVYLLVPFLLVPALACGYLSIWVFVYISCISGVAELGTRIDSIRQ